MSDKSWHQGRYCGNTLWNAISDRLKIERRNLTKMKQENTSKKEKMIMVEKSTKWWMTVVASGSLAVGLLGGLGIASLATNALNQQAKVQTSTTTQAQNNQQQGNQNQGGPGMPPGGQNGNNQGGPNGMPPQQNGDQSDNSNSQNGSGNSNNSKKKAPSNADGSTKSDKNSSTTENNDSNTTNS